MELSGAVGLVGLFGVVGVVLSTLVSSLPANISSYINDFDDSLSEDDYNNVRYSYRVLYVQKSANNKGQADKVIEFLQPNSPESETLNKEYVLIKEREKSKHLPTEIWKKMQDQGYKRFGQHQHTELWKEKGAKDPALGFGTTVVNSWYWYDKWLKEVEKHCKESGNIYK